MQCLIKGPAANNVVLEDFLENGKGIAFLRYDISFYLHQKSFYDDDITGMVKNPRGGGVSFPKRERVTPYITMVFFQPISKQIFAEILS